MKKNRITIICIALLSLFLCISTAGCKKEKDWYVKYGEFIRKYDYKVYEYGGSYDYLGSFDYEHTDDLDSIPSSTHEYSFIVLNLKRDDVTAELISEISDCIHERKYIVIYANFNEYYDILVSSKEDILGDTGTTSLEIPIYSCVDYERELGIDGTTNRSTMDGQEVIDVVYDMIRMGEGLI